MANLCAVTCTPCVRSSCSTPSVASITRAFNHRFWTQSTIRSIPDQGPWALETFEALRHTGDIVNDIADGDDIEKLVRNFYRQAAMDDVLGPVFEAAHVNWQAHVETLIEFWSWQLLGERGYDGHPLRAHESVHDRTPLSSAHYERWLELFCDTVDESFEGPVAEVAKMRGRKMAAAMKRLLSGEFAEGAVAIEPIWRATPAH